MSDKADMFKASRQHQLQILVIIMTTTILISFAMMTCTIKENEQFTKRVEACATGGGSWVLRKTWTSSGEWECHSKDWRGE